MRTRLFDASSIILLAKRSPATAPATLEGEHILDLTKYEIGNAIWKLNKLINKTDKSTAMESMEQAYHLTALMETISLEEQRELTDTMEIAFDGGISFYDSAYLHTARERGLTLVTEDERLRRQATALGVNCERAGA